MKESALKLLAKGVSIIPIGKNKRPLIPTWVEFQAKRALPATVEGWYDTFPEANIGGLTGAISGFVVIDIDPRHGGSLDSLPKSALNTTTIKTGNGGYHLYYKYQKGITNKAGVFPGIDIRGDGGYVVMPPSVTDYEEDGKKVGGKYSVFKDVPMAVFPSEILGTVQGKGMDFDAIALGVGKGERNESAASMAGLILLKKFDRPDEAWELLQTWNNENDPPLSLSELKTTFESIYHREKKKQGEKMLEIHKDSFKFITFSELVTRSMVELDATNPLDCVSFGYDWLDDKLTGLFPGELVVLGGETGVGKTSFATNIIYKASVKNKSAILALEDRLNDYGIKAVYFALGNVRKKMGLKNYPWNAYRKNDIRDANYKKQRQDAEDAIKNDNIYFIEVQEQMNIDLLEAIVEDMISKDIKLFLVDHLHYFDLLRSDSSKADYIEHVMVRLKTLINRTGARMILIAHYKKLDGKKPSIDSFKDGISISQNANYIIHLWRDRTEGTDARLKTKIFIQKSRNPNGEASIEVDYNPDTNDYECVGYVPEKSWSAGGTQKNDFQLAMDKAVNDF